MAHRTFVDNSGRRWAAWSVTPAKVERRNSKPNVKWGFEERRKKIEGRVKLGSHLAGGWLCFETEGEKRRLTPIPVDWENLSDRDLSSLCERADAAPPPRRPNTDS